MDQLTLTPLSLALVVLDLALLVFAARSPWIGLVVLLAGLPFNGFLLDVIAPSLGITSTDTLSRLALAGWHDALSIGVVVAAGWSLVRSRQLPRRSLEWFGAAVLAWGVVALALAPGLLAAAYAYRTLYLPVAMMLAVVILARQGVSDSVLSRAAGAIVASGLIAAAFALWQVYLGGYAYLNAFYQVDSRLPAVYSSAYVHQPRAIGTFHSPNEFGAYLVIAAVIALAPGILSLGRLRPWAGALLGVALLLTFSRSAWVVAIASTLTILFMTGWRPRLAVVRTSLVRHAVPLIVFVAASSLILTTSNGLEFIRATVTGTEPSAALHLGAIGDILTGQNSPSPAHGTAGEAQAGLRITITPLGDGLGTAGPKSARFTGAEPVRHSEIWYLNYVAQVGLVGFALTGLLVASLLVELWRARRRSWPAAASALLLALGVGAVLIPVIDEPAVAGPLWAILGLAVVHTRNARGPANWNA